MASINAPGDRVLVKITYPSGRTRTSQVSRAAYETRWLLCPQGGNLELLA